MLMIAQTWSFAYLEAAITSHNGRVNEVGLEVWFVDEGYRVLGDVGMVVVLDASCFEVVVMWMTWVCDGGTWFLEAENVNGALCGICEDCGEIVGFGDIVGAKSEGLKSCLGGVCGVC